MDIEGGKTYMVKIGTYVIIKEKVGTVGPKLTLYTAWRGKPNLRSRSNFIAESTNKKILERYIRKRCKKGI